MPVHKLITGGGQYLGFALAKLRQLALTAAAQGGYASQRFDLGDAQVELRVVREQQFLRLSGGAARYEFFTSEHIGDGSVANFLASPGGTLPAGVFVIGSMARLEKSGKPKPLYSHTLVSADPEATWDARAITAPPAPSDPLISWNGWQKQKFIEHVCWPNNGRTSMVTSTQAHVSGWNAQWGWRASSVWSPDVYSRDGFTPVVTSISMPYLAVDEQLDMPPTLYSAQGSASGAPAYAHSHIWWRHAAVQTATTGGAFFICTDNIGRFQVYRAKAYQSEVGIDYLQLPPDRYTLVTPPYPEWVTLPDPGDADACKYRHWTWQFDKKARRAVSCPFESVNSPHYLRHKDERFGCIVDGFSVLQDTPTDFAPTREDTPGLVEFGIEITETGDGEMDFEVAFTLLRNEHLSTSGRMVTDAAYALKGTGVEEDTLITSEIECFVAPGNYDAGPTDIPDIPDGEAVPSWASGIYVHSMKRAEIFLTVNALDQELSRTPLHSLPVLNPTSMRFRSPTAFRIDLYNMLLDDWGLAVADLLPSDWLLGPSKTIMCSTVNQPLFDWSGYGSFLTSVRPNLPVEYFKSSRFGISGNGENFRRKSLRLHAIDLRSVSLFYSVEDQFTRKITSTLAAFNKPIKTSERDMADWQTGSFFLRDPVAQEATERVSGEALRLVAEYVMPSLLCTTLMQGFRVHPDGHWAHIASGLGIGFNESSDQITMAPFDMVQVKGRPRTTHKQLFNKAFSQTRDYSFYKEAYPERVHQDFGNFMTNGFWITF